MSIQVMNDIFARLMTTYPVFEDLNTYLGSLGIKNIRKENDALVLFRYNREVCDLTNPVVRAFRSVVWDSLKNRPVFVSPQKSENINTVPTKFDAVIVEEFIDGVMINLFMDPYKGTWRLATRSRLDADNKFYQHTFASLFGTVWSEEYVSKLNPAFGYSFVLQHPLNRIVVPVDEPSLTLVDITMIDASGNLFNTIPMDLFKTPRRFAVTNTMECNVLLSNMEQFEGVRTQGIVLRHVQTNQRWKIRTNTYMACRKLRGNHSQQEYVWFDNYKNGVLEQYLQIYPEERIAANLAIGNWLKVVSDVYNWYVHVFKVRDVAKDNIPVHLKGMLFDLHGQYMSRLAKEKKSLDWKEHQLIMAKQDLKRMVFLSTYKLGSVPPPSFLKRQKLVSEKNSQLEEEMTI